MERMLRNLFDFQKFKENPRLAAMLADAENRYTVISDDDLELISAAGDSNPITPINLEDSDDD